MARDFTSKDTKQLTERLRQLQSMQNEVIAKPEQYRREADRLAHGMFGVHAFAKTARDGVTEGRDTVGSVRDMGKFITCIVRYHQLLPWADYCKKLQASHRQEINRLQSSLSVGGSGLRWMFASSQKKQEAAQAYEALGALLSGEYAANTDKAHAQLHRAEQLSDAQAEQLFLQDKNAYWKTAKTALPLLVQSRDTVAEIDALINRWSALTAPGETAEAQLQQSRQEIVSAATRVAARETLRILEGVPVEEITRTKSGVRVKTLRDSGFSSMADVYRASPKQLADVKGISDEGAAEVRQVAQEYARETARSVKIRLNADDKNDEATALVCAVSRYLNGQDSLRDYRKLFQPYREKVDQAIQRLKLIGSGASWPFYSDSAKQAAHEAYQYLDRLQKSDFAAELQTLSAGISGTAAVSPAQAWQHFERDAVRFNHVLEDIVPDMTGSGSTVYGLPEDLAHAIAQEPLALDGLRCELRRYQEWGVKYILHQKRVLLGDEMGLGKTVQAIAAMTSLRNNGATRFVVVCPASVLANWCREINKHSDLPVIMVHGANRAASLSQWVEKGGVAVTTYETTGFFTLEDDFRFDCMVVDEAHYIKNPDAQRSINVKKLCEKAERLLFMTGTAIENKVDEMISLIQVLQPEVAAQIKKMAFMSSAPQFREGVAPVYYRRRREDVLTELPEKLETMEWCTLSGEEEQLYEQAVLDKKYADARRVSWNVDDLANSCKANRMRELLGEAQQEGRKMIVFSFFLDTIRKVCALLGEQCIGPITGSVTPQRRQEMIDEFNEAPAGAVLAAQIQSGGTGLNIQSASVIVLCEPQFKPSIENQAISRAYRMGQARNVLVYRLLCENTVDEKIMDMLEEKQAVFDAFADKSTIGEETLELDETTFGEIMESERRRIEAKRGEETNSTEAE